MKKGFLDLLFLPILGLLILGVGILSPMQPMQQSDPTVIIKKGSLPDKFWDTVKQTEIGYEGCATIEFKPAGGEWYLHDESCNLVTDTGWNATMDLINGQRGNGFNWSVIGNTSVPSSGSTSHPGLMSNAGLGGQWVDSIRYNSAGNRTTSTLWTYTGTGSVIANTTGFYNATGGAYILGLSFDTATFSTNGDQLRVNHTMGFNEP